MGSVQSDNVARSVCKCREPRERIENSVRGNRPRTTSTLFEWLWPRAWLRIQLRLHSRSCVCLCLCVGEEEQQQRKIVKHKDQKKRNNNNIGNTEERRRVGDRVLLLLKVRSGVWFCFCFCFYRVVLLLSLAYLGLACCVVLLCVVNPSYKLQQY